MEFIKITGRATGQTYWYKKSGFLGECWHIYVSPNNNAWVYNIFQEEEFNRIYEPFNQKKWDEYVASIRNR